MDKKNEKYVRQFNIEKDDVSEEGVLSLKSLAGILEETANGQLEPIDLGTEGLHKKGLAWVIVRREVDIERLPAPGETIYAETFAADARHGLYPRWYELKDEKGENLLTAGCQWCILDLKKREILFSCEEVKEAPVVSKEEYGKRIAARIRFPELTKCKERTVSQEYIDGNGHMNNRYYLSWAEEIALEEGLSTRDLKSIWIEYDRELFPSDTVEICYQLVEEESVESSESAKAEEKAEFEAKRMPENQDTGTYHRKTEFYLKGQTGENCNFAVRLTYRE